MKNCKEKVWEGQSEEVYARKEHKCDFCSKPISKDERYIRLIQYRPFKFWKSCYDCHVTAIRMYGD